VVAAKGGYGYNEITRSKEDFMMELSDKLVKLRKLNGWSQENLAEKLNVSRQAVSRWESGTAQPDASNVLSLSKLFGVTADYLLNDDYESDFDVPVVKQTKLDARDHIKKVIALCVGMFGLMGNFAVFILSRFVQVMVPRITYENGQKMYHWGSDLTGHSYPYFVQAYDLELLVIIFWILFAFGLITVFVPKEKFKRVLNKLKNVKRRKSRNDHIADESVSSF
jgi:transcriptional regulator with XRE-family HTH domain